MPGRIPNTASPTEVRQAFQRFEAQASIITEGASGEILIGAGVGVTPAWGTELTTLTSLTVGNISIDAATITSDTGAIGFGNENLTTTGTVTAVNVTSGNNPGHTHTDVHHGATTGLGDDDHTLYSLADGTRDFSGVIVGVDPTSSNHLATKEYVDSAISFIEEFFLTDTASGIGSYFDMVDQHTGETESSDPTGSITQTDGQALTEWITIANTPSITDLEHGIYSVHLHAEKTGGGARDVVIYFEVYTRTHPGGVETLRATSEVSDLITSRVAIDLHAVLTADVAINETDRIVVKFFANGISGGNNATIILYSEGTTASHFGMPISSEVLSTIFLRQDGTKALTGNMAVDAGITIDGRDISADGTTLDSLTDNSMADALHRHSELSASDGTPDAILTVDAAGAIGINTPSPLGSLHIKTASGGAASPHIDADELVLENSVSSGLSIYSGAAYNGNIFFGDGDDEIIGAIQYTHLTDRMRFYVNNNWRLQISSAGYVGIGEDITPDARLEVETEAAEGRQAITIDQNDADQAFIDYQGTSAANADNNISTWTAGNSIQGFVWVEINGVKKRMAYYNEPTS